MLTIHTVEKRRVKCPYCGNEKGNLALLEMELHSESEATFFRNKTVVTCNHEEGGCDKDFIVTFSINTKIEGGLK